MGVAPAKPDSMLFEADSTAVDPDSTVAPPDTVVVVPDSTPSQPGSVVDPDTAVVDLDPDPDPAPTGMALELVADGLTRPVFLTYAPGDLARVYIVERPGRVRVIRDGELRPAFQATAGSS